MIVAVEAAVYAVVLTVVGYVERREHVDRVAEVPACFAACALRHHLKKWFGGGGEQSLEVLYAARLVFKGSHDVSACVTAVVVAVHVLHDLAADVRFNNLHARKVFHMAFP